MNEFTKQMEAINRPIEEFLAKFFGVPRWLVAIVILILGCTSLISLLLSINTS